MGGSGIQEALDGVLEDIKALGGNGGLIAVSPSGEAAWGFTTPGMYRGLAGPCGQMVRIYDDEESDR
jgi:beta-aspartyl-peptidase (threonine type)